MTQTWHDLLFAHWPVDAAVLREKIPPGFELDTFAAQAWVAVVPFQMANVTPRGVPALPWVSEFPELNVRTYVRVADTPGVYFFSLDAGNPLAVGAARTLAHLPYYTAQMKIDREDGWIRYHSRRTSSGAPPAEFAARYRPVGDPEPPSEGTLEYFLTERYCLYSAAKDGRTYRCEIAHAPWPLQPAKATTRRNTMTRQLGFDVPDGEPLLHYADYQEVVAWMLHLV